MVYSWYIPNSGDFPGHASTSSDFWAVIDCTTTWQGWKTMGNSGIWQGFGWSNHVICRKPWVSGCFGWIIHLNQSWKDLKISFDIDSNWTSWCFHAEFGWVWVRTLFSSPKDHRSSHFVSYNFVTHNYQSLKATTQDHWHELACVSGSKPCSPVVHISPGPECEVAILVERLGIHHENYPISHLRQRTNRPAPRHFKVSCLDKGLAKCEDHMSWVSLEDWKFDIHFWCSVLL